MEDINYYEVLGVCEAADFEEIKKAYRKMARKYHHDMNRTLGSDELFMIVQEAYEVLGDETKRADYDASRTIHEYTKSADYEDDFNYRDYKPVKVPFSILTIIRVLIGLFFLVLIPYGVSYKNPTWLNDLVIYYGWLIVLYLFTKIIYGLTSLGLIIWLIISLVNKQGMNVIFAIGAFFVFSLFVWIINPAVFD